MKGEQRWINFVIPGFDSFNEKRGTYNSSMNDVGQLIIKILLSRKVKKAIYCGHSNGTVFISHMMKNYPHIFKGFVNIAGITNIWTNGMRMVYRIAAHDNGFGYYGDSSSLLKRK